MGYVVERSLFIDAPTTGRLLDVPQTASGAAFGGAAFGKQRRSDNDRNYAPCSAQAQAVLSQNRPSTGSMVALVAPGRWSRSVVVRLMRTTGLGLSETGNVAAPGDRAGH